MKLPRLQLGPTFALVLLLLGGCATPPASTPDATTTPVWPAAPAEARVVFVRSIARPEDLGIAKGFFQRLVDLVVGESEARLIRPMAVVDTGSEIFVADPGARGVHRFDIRSGRYALLRAEGGSSLPSPVGLALGDKGTVYVTDSSLGAVFVVMPGADFATRVVLEGSLVQPTGIAFEGTLHRLYVVDTASHRILVYGADGKLVSTIGRRGTGDGEFNYPTMIWRSSTGKLLITDSLNFRTQVLAPDGGFLGKFGRPGDSSGDSPRQKGVATDRYGHVYVVDSLLHAVQIFDEAGTFLLSVGGQGQGQGEFWLPAGIFIGEGEMIYVADAHNQRIQVFRYVGGPT